MKLGNILEGFYLEGDDVNPAYSTRGVLPIFNSNNDVKFYVKIRHIGSSGTGGSSEIKFMGYWDNEKI